MRDFAQRFAAANPATTPLDAPLPDEALLLLDRVMTPRPDRPGSQAQPATHLPARRSRSRRLVIGILVPAILLTLLIGLVRSCASVPGPWTPSPAEPSEAPSIMEPSATWTGFRTEKELVAASDAIVVAEIIGDGTVDHDGETYYLTTARVTSSGKGDFSVGDYVQIGYLDPWTSDHQWSSDYEGPIPEGSRVLLFLTTPGLEGADAEPVNLTQGSYLVDAAVPPTPGPGNPLELDPDFLTRMGLTIS